MRGLLWSPAVVALAIASCSYPRLHELADAGADHDGEPADAGHQPVSLELLAGDTGGGGNVDGTGTDARFGGAAAAAIDASTNIYVADQGNHTIRKITPAGVVTTLAGAPGVSGSDNGTGAAARFNRPSGVAVDSAGNLYVADSGNHTIRKITAAGVVTTLAGTAGMPGTMDATGAAARFRGPAGVTVDAAGNVYVADTLNCLIRAITAAGVVTTLAGSVCGSSEGTGPSAQFNDPPGLVVDTTGNLYVADQHNHTIRKVTSTGVVTTFAGSAGISGDTDNTGSDARFNQPAGIAIDHNGNLYVADQSNHTIRRISTTRVVTTLVGTPGVAGTVDGTGAAARLNRPSGVAVDASGDYYVADLGNAAIRKVTAAGVVTTFAGRPALRGGDDGTGAAARFVNPQFVATDKAGNIYVADSNQTIRKVTPDGVVTTLAGNPGVSGAANGKGTAASFNFPVGVAVDDTGIVYIADSNNHTIRKMTTDGVVTTLAGMPGMNGTANGTGADARFDDPLGIVADSNGDLYVADGNNNTIRKVTAAGVVTTIAGNPGMTGSANGTGTAAQFNLPAGLALDSTGNLYVADFLNHTIRKVAPGGVVTTLAGNPAMTGSTDDTGAAARFLNPTGLAIDRAGNLYTADLMNANIRKITPEGVTTTIAGIAGVSGILLGTTPRLAGPIGLTIVGDSIAISDNNAILLLRHGAQ